MSSIVSTCAALSGKIDFTRRFVPQCCDSVELPLKSRAPLVPRALWSCFQLGGCHVMYRYQVLGPYLIMRCISEVLATMELKCTP